MTASLMCRAVAKELRATRPEVGEPGDDLLCVEVVV
jgi:hypothetical protein